MLLLECFFSLFRQYGLKTSHIYINQLLVFWISHTINCILNDRKKPDLSWHPTHIRRLYFAQQTHARRIPFHTRHCPWVFAESSLGTKQRAHKMCLVYYCAIVRTSQSNARDCNGIHTKSPTHTHTHARVCARARVVISCAPAGDSIARCCTHAHKEQFHSVWTHSAGKGNNNIKSV